MLILIYYILLFSYSHLLYLYLFLSITAIILLQALLLSILRSSILEIIRVVLVGVWVGLWIDIRLELLSGGLGSCILAVHACSLFLLLYYPYLAQLMSSIDPHNWSWRCPIYCDMKLVTTLHNDQHSIKIISILSLSVRLGVVVRGNFYYYQNEIILKHHSS